MQPSSQCSQARTDFGLPGCRGAYSLALIPGYAERHYFTSLYIGVTETVAEAPASKATRRTFGATDNCYEPRRTGRTVDGLVMRIMPITV